MLGVAFFRKPGGHFYLGVETVGLVAHFIEESLAYGISSRGKKKMARSMPTWE